MATSMRGKLPASQKGLVYSAAVIPLVLYLLRNRLSTMRPKAMTPLNTPALLASVKEFFVETEKGRELLIADMQRGRVSKVLIKPTKPATFAIHRDSFLKQPPSIAGRRVGINAEFFRQLRAIMMIIVPRANSKEVFLFTLHTSFLLLRTYLSLLVARLDGRLVRDLVSADGPGFLRGLGLWFALALPSMYTNSMIRFLSSKLAISFRTRLTRYTHDLYLNDSRNYYKALNLDNRLEGVDQYLTTDLARFCESLSSLYSNLSKPILDSILFNIQLGRSIGKKGSAGLFLSYLATAWVLRKVTPPFGKLAAAEARLEGDFRNAHSRLIVNSEEIAFYDGERLEKDILTRTYLRLIRHVNSVLKIRILYTMTEDLIVKYLWSASGYCLISIPVFFGLTAGRVSRGSDGSQVAARTESYISNRRLLLSLADAGGRIMFSNKELAELAGYTHRVYSLLSTLHSLNINQFQPAKEPLYSLGSVNGVLVDQPNCGVDFDHAPVVAPAPGRKGDELVADLSFTVSEGQHILITGPNGSGKTSIARVLAGLWPVFEGIVRRPGKGEIFFLPQRPYLSLGSLRDQVIYPHSYPQFKSSGGTDEDLIKILELVHLAYLPDREGGFDTIKEWKDVLSGGEKQRMQMARLFYARPQFAVLDESTSAVSTDVEGLIYQAAKDMGITLITISHRPSLFKYHSHLLSLTGDEGKWKLEKLGSEQMHASFQAEAETLQAALAEEESMRARLSEISKEMAFS